MPDPAFIDVAATEAAATKILEKTDASADKIRAGAETTARAATQLRECLQEGWEKLSDRFAETRARIPAFKQELRDDAERVAERARHYHETQPLNALGVIAAAAFVLGVAIGFGRR